MSAEAQGEEILEAAEELYILGGLSFERAARRCGVSASKLKRWSAASYPSWPERRREYRQARMRIRRGLTLAKARLIEALVEDEDPRKANAFMALVRAERGMREDFLYVSSELAGIKRSIRTPKDAVIALEEAVSRRLGALLSGFERVDLAAVKDLAAALELIERMKERYAQEEEGADSGLTDEAAAAIRTRILGLAEDC